MPFFTRPATEADAEGMVALLNPIIEAGIYSIMDQPLSLVEQIAFIREFPPRGVFYVAVSSDNQSIIGLQDITPLTPKAFQHVGEISTFVGLEHQGQGIGHTLTKVTCQAAQAQGILKVCATVRADNPQAVSFYRRQGFQVIGTAAKQAFLHGNYIDEVLLERFLEPF